jgi:hypothetical protein
MVDDTYHAGIGFSRRKDQRGKSYERGRKKETKTKINPERSPINATKSS